MPPPTLVGVRANALSSDQRSSRIGAVLATVPAGSATTTDIAWNAGSFNCSKTASPFLVISLRLHETVEPNGPWKHATRAMSAGPGDPHVHPADVLLPLVADRVPEQLVVVGEPVHRAPHTVDDLVGMAAGDRRVGVADPDHEVAVLLLGLTSSGVPAGEARTESRSIG